MTSKMSSNGNIKIGISSSKAGNPLLLNQDSASGHLIDDVRNTGINTPELRELQNKKTSNSVISEEGSSIIQTFINAAGDDLKPNTTTPTMELELSNTSPFHNRQGASGE